MLLVLKISMMIRKGQQTAMKRNQRSWSRNRREYVRFIKHNKILLILR